MPYINVKILKKSTTREQKNALIHGITKVLSDVLEKNPKSTIVVIDEVEAENWGSGGEPIADRLTDSRSES